MKTIKFRAWDEILKKFWNPGTVNLTAEGKPFTLTGMKGDKVFAIEKLDNMIIEEFTGFTDAGKSELYEGDTIENDGVNYTIGWDEDNGCWDCVDSEGNNIALSELASIRETWLQGNYHENIKC